MQSIAAQLEKFAAEDRTKHVNRRKASSPSA